jgi:hypothetical protein
MSRLSKLQTFTFFVAIMSLGLLASCYRNVDRGEWSIGSHLSINVSNVEQLSVVPYTEDGKEYVIRPRNPANLLTVAKVLLVNRKSSRIALLIDTRAAAMLNRNLVRYPAVDPFGDQRKQSDTTASSEPDLYLPFLWGEISLGQDTELQGWMVFETPPQFEPFQFRWDQAETLFVRP